VDTYFLHIIILSHKYKRITYATMLPFLKQWIRVYPQPLQIAYSTIPWNGLLTYATRPFSQFIYNKNNKNKR
jgi:hypothetical protein